MTTTFRMGKPEDARACAQLFIMASHGIAEAVYRDLIPGQTTEQIIGERRIRPEGRLSSYTHWRVAEDGFRNIAAGINALPYDDMGQSSPDELLTEERIRVIAPLLELDAKAAGTYFINVVAVFPEYRHAGIARRLISLAFDDAKKAGIATVSLTTFEEDRRLVEYYCGLGFAVAASRPIVPHECLACGGNLILMKSPVR